MAAKKQIKLKTRTSSKKQGFKLRWWMAVLLILVVTVVGVAVLRFSQAAAGSYTWYYNNPLSTAVLAGFANAKTEVQADESFVQVVGGQPNQSSATIRVRWQVNNGNKPTGSFRGEVYADGQPLYNDVFVLGPNERKWVESRDINVSAGSNLTYKAVAESGSPTLEQITRYTTGSQGFVSGGGPSIGGSNPGGTTSTNTQPVRLGSCGQPLPQGESGNTPQKCPGQQVNQPGGQPYIYYNFDVPGGKQRVDTTCGYRNAGGYAVVCPNDFGGKNNSKSWQYVGWIGNDSWRQMGVGNERDIGAFKKGGLCGVKSSLQLGLGWLGDNNTALYLVPCDQLQQTLQAAYPACNPYNSSCDDKNWVTWDGVPDTVWTYRNNGFNQFCWTRTTQRNGQHLYSNPKFCPSFDSGNFRLKLPSAGKFNWLNQFVPAGAPTWNPIYPQRDDPVVQNCGLQFKASGGCPLRNNTIKVTSDWLGIPAPNNNKKICVYTSGLSNPAALNGKLAIKVTAANSKPIGILKPTYQPVLSGDGKTYQAYCQDLKGRADYKQADIYVEGSEFGMPAGAENAKAIEYWSWPQ